MIKLRKKPSSIHTYIRGHKRALKEGLIMPWRSPIKSFMTVLTLSICFFIPLFLWTLWVNYEEVKQSWQNQGSIAIFLDGKIDLKQAGIILQEIKAIPLVKSASLLSSQKVKSKLNTDSQLAQIIEQIKVHDLPRQISIKTKEQVSIQEIESMVNNFNINPQVEYVSYDQQWLSQLNTLTNTLLQMARLSAFMFILIIMVILGNTIASEVSAHKNELRLLELIGASWAQVRRGFLYMGTFFGVYAGILALVFLSISLWWFKDKIKILSQSFGTQISIHSLSFNQIIFVILASITITWLAARLSLSIQKLNQIQS